MQLPRISPTNFIKISSVLYKIMLKLFWLCFFLWTQCIYSKLITGTVFSHTSVFVNIDYREMGCHDIFQDVSTEVQESYLDFDGDWSKIHIVGLDLLCLYYVFNFLLSRSAHCSFSLRFLLCCPLKNEIKLTV